MIHPCACTFDAKISLTGEITFEICTTSDRLLRVVAFNFHAHATRNYVMMESLDLTPVFLFLGLSLRFCHNIVNSSFNLLHFYSTHRGFR